MTPLRQQMIRELQLQRKAPATLEAYVTAVAHLAQVDRCSPDQLAVEQVRQFIHHLIVERKLSRDTVNQKICGIQCFYRYVLRQEGYSLRVPLKSSGCVPDPLGRGKVQRLFEAVRNRKHRVLLMTTYGGGFRCREVVRLRRARRKLWTVYSQPPFAGPHKLLGISALVAGFAGSILDFILYHFRCMGRKSESAIKEFLPIHQIGAGSEVWWA